MKYLIIIAMTLTGCTTASSVRDGAMMGEVYKKLGKPERCYITLWSDFQCEFICARLPVPFSGKIRYAFIFKDSILVRKVPFIMNPDGNYHSPVRGPK